MQINPQKLSKILSLIVSISKGTNKGSDIICFRSGIIGAYNQISGVRILFPECDINKDFLFSDFTKAVAKFKGKADISITECVEGAVIERNKTKLTITSYVTEVYVELQSCIPDIPEHDYVPFPVMSVREAISSLLQIKKNNSHSGVFWSESTLVTTNLVYGNTVELSDGWLKDEFWFTDYAIELLLSLLTNYDDPLLNVSFYEKNNWLFIRVIAEDDIEFLLAIRSLYLEANKFNLLIDFIDECKESDRILGTVELSVEDDDFLQPLLLDSSTIQITVKSDAVKFQTRNERRIAGEMEVSAKTKTNPSPLVVTVPLVPFLHAMKYTQQWKILERQNINQIALFFETETGWSQIIAAALGEESV
jgi:hypothetical protein